MSASRTEALLGDLEESQGWLEDLYRDLHRHPELAMQEHRTAGVVAARLEALGYAVRHVGGGVVGVLPNGDGPCVLFRADMDGLPTTENTGLDYASVETTVDEQGRTVGVMHACGHDMSMASALGAADALSRHRAAWSGTHVALFQPGEETGQGARAMVDAGVADAIPTPVVALAQHVFNHCDSGEVAISPGVIMGGTTVLEVTIRGVDSHWTYPHLGVDPIVIGSAVVQRLQSLVAREVPPGQFAVVHVGTFHAGDDPSLIPSTAVLRVSVRSYHERIHRQLVEAVHRVVRAECAASGAPLEPEIVVERDFPVTWNEPEATDTVRSALLQHFGRERVHTVAPAPATEDFNVFPEALDIPSVYWSFGGYPAGRPRIDNHDASYAPVIQPTLRTGTEAAVVACLAFLGPPPPGGGARFSPHP